jgi:hypothetical protein
MILPSARLKIQIFKKIQIFEKIQTFSDKFKSFDGDENRIIIQNWLKRFFGEDIEFKHFFGEPDERLTIQELKFMYEQKQSLDQTKPSGGRSICKTHKCRSNKRRLDKRQRKSKNKSKSNK